MRLYFRKKVNLFIVLGFSLIMTSCFSVRYYQAEMLYPAGLPHLTGIKNVGLISDYEINIDFLNTDTASLRIDSLMCETVLDGASGIFSEIQLFNQIPLSSEARFKINSTISDPLPIPLKIEEIHGHCPDSLEVLMRLSDLKYSLQPQKFFNEFGEVINGLSLISTSLWQLFDFNKKMFKIYRVSDTLAVPEVFEILDIVDPVKSPNGLKYFIESSHNLGESFASYLVPTWMDIERVYFRSSTIFRGTNKHVDAGDWKQAAEIWKEFTYTSDDFIASRACYNMAVAAEMNGYLELAFEWLEKAKGRGLDEYIEQYRAILEYRQKINSKLEEQIGTLN